MIWLWMAISLADPGDTAADCRAEDWSCLYTAARMDAAHPALQARLAHETAPEARLMLAQSYGDTGDPRAEATYLEAIAAFAGDAHGEARARLAYVSLLSATGRGGEAEAQLRRAEEAAAGDALLQAKVKAQRGRVLWRQGADQEEAIRLMREVEAVAFPDGPYQLKLLTLHVLAGASVQLGRVHEAWSYGRRMIALTRERGDRFVEATATLNHVELLVDHPHLATDPEEPLRLALANLEVAREGQNPFIEAGTLCLLGRLVPIEEARATLADCEARYEALGDGWGRIFALHRLAAREVGVDADAAEAALDRAAAVQPFDAVTEVEASYLRALVAWRRGDGAAASASEEALDRIEALRDNQADLVARARVASPWVPATHRLARHALDEDVDLALRWVERMRGRALLAVLELAGRDRARERLAEPPTVAELAAALGPDEALLTYQLPPRDPFGMAAVPGWLLLVRRNGAEVLPLPDTQELSRAVSMYTGLADHGDARVPASRLHELLLAPALERLGPEVRHLVVVPEGPLLRLPFAALRPAPDAPPLVERYAVSTVPSATLWLRWRRAPVTPGHGALVLADPGGELPWARWEAEVVADRLGGTVRLGAEATEEVLRAGTDHAVLHLAAHARIDDANPARSAVHLASGEEDGLLRLADIVDLPLAGRVVVLSACESAHGEEVRGEGILGLARAFFEAGAPVVVGNLWPVRDDDAALLMAHFYDHLADGASVAEALARAQRDRARQGAPPAAWAGMIVIGDGNLRPIAPRRPWPYALGLLGLAGLGVGWRKSRRS